jgi:hypothetical protein
MSTPRRATARLLLAGAVAGAVACGSSGGALAGGDPFAGGGAAAEIRIRVRNTNFLDATLTAIGDASQRRLGVVGGNQTSVFSLPWADGGTLRVRIDLLAGPSCTTDAISVSPGEAVDLEIASATGSAFCR